MSEFAIFAIVMWAAGAIIIAIMGGWVRRLERELATAKIAIGDWREAYELVTRQLRSAENSADGWKNDCRKMVRERDMERVKKDAWFIEVQTKKRDLGRAKAIIYDLWQQRDEARMDCNRLAAEMNDRREVETQVREQRRQAEAEVKRLTSENRWIKATSKNLTASFQWHNEQRAKIREELRRFMQGLVALFDESPESKQARRAVEQLRSKQDFEKGNRQGDMSIGDKIVEGLEQFADCLEKGEDDLTRCRKCGSTGHHYLACSKCSEF